jgi:hypothetical protein
LARCFGTLSLYNIKYNQLLEFFRAGSKITSYLKPGYFGTNKNITMHQYNHLPALKITSIYKAFINTAIKSSFCITKTMSKPIQNSPCIITGAFILFNKCPVAKAEGASGSQVSPDSSACPAGPRPFCVYRWYTLPPANSFKGRF